MSDTVDEKKVETSSTAEENTSNAGPFKEKDPNTSADQVKEHSDTSAEEAKEHPSGSATYDIVNDWINKPRRPCTDTYCPDGKIDGPMTTAMIDSMLEHMGLGDWADNMEEKHEDTVDNKETKSDNTASTD